MPTNVQPTLSPTANCPTAVELTETHGGTVVTQLSGDIESPDPSYSSRSQPHLDSTAHPTVDASTEHIKVVIEDPLLNEPAASVPPPLGPGTGEPHHTGKQSFCVCLWFTFILMSTSYPNWGCQISSASACLASLLAYTH